MNAAPADSPQKRKRTVTPREQQQQRPYASHDETDRPVVGEHHDATRFLVRSALRKYVSALASALLKEAKITELLTAEEIMEEAYFSSSFGELKLMGNAEIVAYLGLRSKGRLQEIRNAKSLNFPPPVADLAMGPVWLTRDIERFKKTWRRKNGRPRKVTDEPRHA